ncbi:MFS transporter [Lentzea sp. NPDC060358]|uniref:MFS transporter n=1 Tax=Lentzea sp. NPDC060358 TaxID=3347103 RepID=UPI00365ECB06
MPRTLPPLLLALLAISFAQQLLTPLFPALTRDLSLGTAQYGLVLSVAAVAMALSSPLWGLVFDLLGLRPVLVAGLALCVAGLGGFALAVTFAADETLPSGLAFVALLVCRSLLLGVGLAAFPVAALATAGTSHESRRTGAVGLVGAASGLAAALGPLVGGGLAVVSLMLPLFLAPMIAVAVAVVVLVSVKPEPFAEQPARLRPWEVLPAFGVGFLLHLSFGLAEVVVLLLVRDRLQTEVSAGATGVVPLVAAIGLVGTQGVLVPLLKWPPGRLMKVGAPVALAGYLVLAVAPSVLLAALGFLVVAVGLGFAVTGFAAAATFGAGSRHQGVVAGLVNATAGLAVVLAPVASGLLYDVDPLAPVVAAAVAAALAAGLALVPVGPSRVPPSGQIPV